MLGWKWDNGNTVFSFLCISTGFQISENQVGIPQVCHSREDGNPGKSLIPVLRFCFDKLPWVNR
jgi:hypothetical protein